MIKRKIQELILAKCNQYLQEMKQINEDKAFGYIPKDTLAWESANLRYAVIELKLNILAAFLPQNTG